MRLGIVVLSSMVAAGPLVAQEGQQAELRRPADWMVRFDRPGMPDTAVYFVSMPPGWHITTGPAAILYDPARTGSGEYRIESTIVLFDPGRRHREAYGIFFGGRNLDGDGQTYSYFLIRDTGEFLVKRRTGSSTATVRPWTASSAIMKHPGDANAKNVLAVECGARTVDFYINGEQVVSIPRSELDADGVVGLRVNHSLNLHVTELKVERKGRAGGR